MYLSILIVQIYLLNQDETFTPRKEDDVGSRYVPFDPVSDTCAPSAHSETSTRKNAFQRSLVRWFCIWFSITIWEIRKFFRYNLLL